MVVYHNLVFIYKIKCDKKPAYFYSKISKKWKYETRLASSGNIKNDQKVTSDLGRQNFINMGTSSWNSLPEIIKQSKSLKEFKVALKTWITKNIPVK